MGISYALSGPENDQIGVKLVEIDISQDWCLLECDTVSRDNLSHLICYC